MWAISNLFKSLLSGREEISVPYDKAEERTKQEKVTRMFNTPRARAKRSEDSKLFDHFLVVGCEQHEDVAQATPKILYRFSNDTKLEFQSLEDFCFPTGFHSSHVPRIDIDDKYTKDLAAQKMPVRNLHIKNQQNSFIFTLTSEKREIRYGICVIDDIIQAPSFLSVNDGASETAQSHKTASPSVTQRDTKNSNIFTRLRLAGKQNQNSMRSYAYLFITSYPFFNLYFDLIYNILELDYCTGIVATEVTVAQQFTSETHPVIKILHKFYETPVPVSGKAFKFQIGNGIEFRRPAIELAEEDELLSEYCLPILFHVLSEANILWILSAILLEKKIVFVSNNLRVLSSCVLSYVPLVRPFRLQSVVIPILPDKLLAFLEAPVPVLIGVPNSDLIRRIRDSFTDVIIVDIDRNRITCPSDIKVPNISKATRLVSRIAPYYSQFQKVTKKMPYFPQPDQTALVECISSETGKHFDYLFNDFQRHCVTNLTSGISVFMRESFLSETSSQFLRAFIDTQTFDDYAGKKLAVIDAEKRREFMELMRQQKLQAELEQQRKAEEASKRGSTEDESSEEHHEGEAKCTDNKKEKTEEVDKRQPESTEEKGKSDQGEETDDKNKEGENKEPESPRKKRVDQSPRLSPGETKRKSRAETPRSESGRSTPKVSGTRTPSRDKEDIDPSSVVKLLTHLDLSVLMQLVEVKKALEDGKINQDQLERALMSHEHHADPSLLLNANTSGNTTPTVNKVNNGHQQSTDDTAQHTSDNSEDEDIQTAIMEGQSKSLHVSSDEERRDE
jgi:hypothetical protein